MKYIRPHETAYNICMERKWLFGFNKNSTQKNLFIYFTSHDYVEYIHIWLRLLHYGLWLPLHELIVLLSLLNATFGIKHLLFLWVEISLSTRSCCDDRNCFKVNRTSVNLWTCLRCPRSKEKLIFLHHFFLYICWLLLIQHRTNFILCYAHISYFRIYIYILFSKHTCTWSLICLLTFSC